MRNVSGALYHDLYIVRPCALGQFTETDKLLDLADIRCVCKTSRAAGITQRDGHIVFLADIQNLIKIFIERIFLSGHAHPGKHQRASAAADDIHFSFMLFDLIDGFSGDSAVKGDKIHAVLGMKADHIDKILCGQRRQDLSDSG